MGYLETYAATKQQKPTPAEWVLWQEIQQHLTDVFVRQQVLFRYIVDFYCPTLKLVIEVDGHSHRGKKVKDDERQNALRDKGFTMLRFSNDEVIFKPQEVIKSIKSACGLIRSKGRS